MVGNANPKFDVQYKAFSDDLCSGWLLHDADPALAEGAVEGYLNLYRRENCGEGADGYEALTTLQAAEHDPRLRTGPKCRASRQMARPASFAPTTS